MDTLGKNTLIFYFSQLGIMGTMVTSVVLSWLKFGLSFSQILFLQGLFGFLCNALGTFVYSLSTNYGMFLLSESILALGLASISGSDSANIWDTYLEFDKEKSAKKTLAMGRSIMIISSAFFISLGGIIASYSLKTPFYLSSTGFVMLAVLWLFAYEPKRDKSEGSKSTTKQSLGLLRNKKYLEAVIAILILAVVLRILFWAYIPLMSDLPISDILYGTVIGIGGLIAGLISFSLSRRVDYPKILDYIGILFAFLGTILFVIKPNIFIFLIALGFQQISRGIISVFISFTVNEVANSEFRASAVSLNSSIGQLFYLIFTGLINLFSLNLQMSLIVNLVFVSMLVIVFLYLKFNEKGKLIINDKIMTETYNN